MRCRKAMKDISRLVDGELPERERARLERHLAACPGCRELEADLRKIVAGAARLGAPEPSGRVWASIRADLAGRPAEAAAGRKRAFRRPAPGAWLPAFRYAGVAAAAVVLVAAGIVAGRRVGRGPAAPGPEARERYTLAKLDEAERHYQQAITSLSEAFAAQKGVLAPEVAEVFDRNLSVIDATIQACRRAVSEEPDDLDARNYLMAAYTQKITVLDDALDLQRRGRDAANGRKII
ncbi:MAG: zf-HC2 domain-containing protein [Acidobacteriota bacterium]